MHDTALTEIKALLTLALLKSGTSARDIRTAIGVAATTRLMAGEEGAELGQDDSNVADANVTNIRQLRHGNATPVLRERKGEQPISGLNGDVKALLSLLLLQHGATSREILTTLRMAATPRAQDDEQTIGQDSEQDSEQTEFEQATEAAANAAPEVAQKPEIRSADARTSTAKQRLRNDYLAPIARSPHAA
jgi:hypothetical protein